MFSVPKGLFLLSSLLLHIYIVKAWETMDTCQLAFIETDKDAAWRMIFIPVKFSTDKSGMYDYILSLMNGTYEFDNHLHTTGVTDPEIKISASSDDTR